MKSIVLEVIVIALIAFLLGGMCATIIHAANASHGYTVCNHD